jgi:predicted nucleotide-binding protein
VVHAVEGIGGDFVGEYLGSDAEDQQPPRDRVFVIHGRDERAKEAVFTLLRALDLKPTEWSTAVSWAGGGAPMIRDVLQAGFSRCWAVVALFTPDDLGELRWMLRDHQKDGPHETSQTGQARQNVVFETGAALAIRPERTVLVEFGHTRPLSDLAGYHWVRIGESAEWRQDLAERLRQTGAEVETTGKEWRTAGDFTANIRQRATWWNGAQSNRGYQYLLDRVELLQAHALYHEISEFQVCYAALSAAQQNIELNFWASAIKGIEQAAPLFTEFVADDANYKHPRVRAAGILQSLPLKQTESFIARALEYDSIDDTGRQLLEAVRARRLLEFIKERLTVEDRNELIPCIRDLPKADRLRLT